MKSIDMALFCMSADNNNPEFALSWLRLAEEDLKSARKLLSPPDPIWKTAVYHCQQAAEKASKALLALHGEDIPFKHDIGLLLEKLEKYEKGLIGFEVAAESLTIFATEYRYPNANAKPLTQEIVDKTVRDAESIVSRAISLILHPSEKKDGGGDGSGGGAGGVRR